MAKADNHRTPSERIKEPLLKAWQRLNCERGGEPSDLLKQMRSMHEGLQRWAQQPHIQELRENMRRLQESGLAERIMGRMRPVSVPKSKASPKRKRRPGGGRKPKLTADEKAQCLAILRSEGRMTVDAAEATLQAHGYKIERTTTHKLWKRAYGSS